MYDWGSFLIDTAWLGAFAMVAIISLLESRFPLLQRPAVSRPPNLLFGLLTLASTLFGTHALAEPLTGLAYQFRVFTLSDMPGPVALKIIAGVLFIDLAMYVNHVVSHKLPLLWRIHQVHHADPLVTSSTGLLHHPLEAIWAFVLLMVVNVMCGVPLGSIMIYASATAFHSIFSHSNLRLPEGVTHILGYVIVMPDMHRIHHSIDPTEGNSNYGQIFSFWDRLFRTFTLASKRQGEDFRMGLTYVKEKELGLVPLIRLPFEHRS
jgi:sterol desaturase/sphingolipid hydroxylase (fatty acid hydroxylase superfamily)